jgi:dienelactone hydrolase
VSTPHRATIGSASRRALLPLFLLGLGPELPAREGSAPDGSPTVLQYLGERASRLAAQAVPARPPDLPAWEARRPQVREHLRKVLGLPAVREPMRARVLSSTREGEVMVEEVMYLWAERAYVSANVVRPVAASGPWPALVMPPGWLGQLGQDFYRTFVQRQAREGCLVLFIDDPHVGQRAAPNAGLYGVAAAAGTQVMGIQVFDTLRGLDYLLTRPDVDPGRIGVAGLCQGSEQTWLAAALEDRFQLAVPVCGTTTYEGWARMPAFLGVDLSDPSPYVGNILRHTDWHEINACIAPRPVFIASNSGDNWWPKEGYDRVVRTLEHTFQLYGHPERFTHLLDLRSHSLTPFIPELVPWINRQFHSLPATTDARRAPAGPPVDPDFSMLRHFQRRIAREAEARPSQFASREAWAASRDRMAAWLRATCALDTLHPGPGRRISQVLREGILVEEWELPLDGDFTSPARLFRPPEAASARHPAVILSHDSSQCLKSPRLERAARELVARGCWVLAPEHASLQAASLRRVQSNGLVSFYGVADTVGLPPLALRVADNLAAFNHLLGRPECDPRRILFAGLGVGGVDACLAGVLEGRVAGVASVGATTARAWAEEVAPGQAAFSQIMPYLPGLLEVTDLEYFFAALAPRPALVVRWGNPSTWPAAGYERIADLAGRVYRLLDAGPAFAVARPDELPAAAGAAPVAGDIQTLLRDAARALLSAPNQSGQVGGPEALVPRQNLDTAPGVIWVLGEGCGQGQEFAGTGARLTRWSFYNGRGPGEKGRAITPLIFRRQGQGYVLTGVGQTRINDGTGRQTHDFAVAAGRDTVGEGYYFGCFGGAGAGPVNAGVIEFDDGTEDAIDLLTLDGQTPNQALRLGALYQAKARLPRTYSVQAVSNWPDR